MWGRGRSRIGYLVVLVGCLLVVAVGVSSARAASYDAGRITEFPAPCTGGFPGLPSIAAGPDGNLWFSCGPEIGRISPSGKGATFSLESLKLAVSGLGVALGIAAGPDGNLWYADPYGAIGRITPNGHVTEFTAGLLPPIPNSLDASSPQDIVRGPDGNLWFTADGVSAIGRITTGGVITEFTAGLIRGSNPGAIVAGPDGNLWFTDSACSHSFGASCAIGRITPSGEITEFRLADGEPSDIAAGPDGNMWFTDQGHGSPRIGRITPSGQVTTFSAGLQSSDRSILDAIAAGPDGNLWFADDGGSQAVGRITPAGVISEFSTGLASSAIHGPGILDLTAGPDGNVWFVGRGDTIGRIDTGSGAGPGPAPATSEAPAVRASCVVPDLEGLTLSRAERALTKADCRVGKVTRRRMHGVKPDRVASSRPGAGKHLAAGARVGLVVAR